MKPSETFKNIIEQRLKVAAQHNSVFAEKLKNSDKNIDDCITYIFNQVKSSGCNGFEDTEIYGMAMHYYDEDDIEVGKPINAKVVVNQEVKLTEEEIKEARDKAKEQVLAEEMARLRKKPAKEDPEKKPEEGTLF